MTTTMPTTDSVDRYIHRHSRSFSIASRFLPADVRADVQKLYAWCRVCDDAVDAATDADSARDELEQLRSDIIQRSEMASPVHPASVWMIELIRDRDVDPQHALDLIEGMRMDLDGDSIDTDDDLRRYAYHVAGVVGLMMCRVMGVRDAAADRPAMDLGIAMQLTNIARDVLEDAERGRCYLPGINDPTTADQRDVESSVRRILAMANRYYASGRSGIAMLPRRCRMAVGLAANLYQEIGIEIVRRDCQVMAGRTVLPRYRILGIVGTTLFPLTCFQPLHRRTPMNATRYDAPYIAYLGLSLTAFMATSLFLLVYLNPKESTYTWLPLVYAGASLAIGIVCNRLAAQNERATTLPADVNAPSH